MPKGLRDILKQAKLDKTFLQEMFNYFLILRKHNGSSGTMVSAPKLRALILRESHVLEKGMSMPAPHFPFGTERALALIDSLKTYIGLPDHDTATVSASIAVIRCYIDCNINHGADIHEIVDAFDSLTKALSSHYNCDIQAGTIDISRSDITVMARADFESLLKSRHSHRNFAEGHVPRELIEKALGLASLTPSACNRQAWRTHVFSGDKVRDILDWQGGCRGFADKIKDIIIITADLNSFFAHEPMQAYVDGGMYAMNLINSLHYYGLGSIPLSCGFSIKKLNALHGFGVPTNEIPILIIGIGLLPEKCVVAASKRFDFTKTNTFHE